MSVPNPQAPHKVVIHMHVTIHEVMQTGELGPWVAPATKKVFQLSGEDRAQAESLATGLIEEINSVCQ